MNKKNLRTSRLPTAEAETNKNRNGRGMGAEAWGGALEKFGASAAAGHARLSVADWARSVLGTGRGVFHGEEGTFT